MDNKNKKTIWFFGDSFTQSLGVRYNEKYLKIIGDKRYDTWTDLISDYLGGVPKVIAKGGICNQEIINNTYNYFHEMNPDDYCIIGGTNPMRTLGYSHVDNQITSYNNDMIDLYISDNETFEQVTQDKSEGYNAYLPISSKEKLEILINYVHTFIYPNQEIYNNYYDEQFTNIIKNLNKINVNGYFWSYKLWTKFSTFTDETNSEFVDDHWGGIGNYDFYKYLVNCIENGNNIITS